MCLVVFVELFWVRTLMTRSKKELRCYEAIRRDQKETVENLRTGENQFVLAEDKVAFVVIDKETGEKRCCTNLTILINLDFLTSKYYSAKTPLSFWE